MPANTRDIKGRMKAVGNIERITKTMQMIATAQFQSLFTRASQARQYTIKLGELVQDLAAAMGGSADAAAAGGHPLLRPVGDTPGREVLLVITSNRGLCGAYNANVLREATAFLDARRAAGADVSLQVRGKKAVSFFRFKGRAIDATHGHIGDKPQYDDVEALAQRYMDAFIEGKVDRVSVAYMAFESKSRQVPVVEQLLPMQPPEAGGSETAADRIPSEHYDFSPEPAELLAALLPRAVKTRLFQWVSEAVVSEQLARMTAMKQATDAAGKMKKSLKRQFNRARQTAITTEISEIVGGAAALE